MTTASAGINIDGLLALGTIIGVGTFALDLAFGAGITGVLATLGMLPVVALLVRTLLRDESWRVRRRLRALIGVDVFVAFVLVAMVIARIYIWLQQFGAEDASVYTQAARLYTLVFVVVAVLSGLSAAMPGRIARMLLRLIQRPALLLAGSFASIITVMTLLLALPPAVEDVSDISFVDALFTITSAVCVTGLTVNDPGTTYTAFGEIVILLSIQLGGMGIMTIAALSLMFARDTALSTQLRYAQMMDVRTLSDLRTTVGSIVVGTLAIEAVGALVLWWMFEGEPAIGDASAAWMGVFHAVSAFCNAGFSLVEGELTKLDTRVAMQVVIMFLVVSGGIGFPVLRELFVRGLDWAGHLLDRRRTPRPPALSLATRIVLSVSGILVLGGALLFALLEWSNAFGHLGSGHRVLAALFMSVNLRTAGFYAVDIGTLTTTSLAVACVLMFIGGSPGSTAGGIKTTTLATIVATMRGELSGREPNLGRRALSAEVVRRAVAVTALSVAIVLGGLLALTLTESHPFESILFEVVSAFGTVGLSRGITPELTTPGKLLVSAMMFVGRVGPLTIALAVGSSAVALRYRLARESLPIG